MKIVIEIDFVEVPAYPFVEARDLLVEFVEYLTKYQSTVPSGVIKLEKKNLFADGKMEIMPNGQD